MRNELLERREKNKWQAERLTKRQEAKTRRVSCSATDLEEKRNQKSDGGCMGFWLQIQWISGEEEIGGRSRGEDSNAGSLQSPKPEK